MHCLRLQNLTGTEHILHNQDFMPNGIHVYTSDIKIKSHYRAFQRFCAYTISDCKASSFQKYLEMNCCRPLMYNSPDRKNPSL